MANKKPATGTGRGGRSKGAASDGGETNVVKGQFKEEAPETYDGAEIIAIIEAIEDQQAEVDEVMAQARKACQPHRDKIKAQISAAAELGVPKRVLSTFLAQRRFLEKAQIAPSKLNEQMLIEYRKLKDSLGDFADLPLGKYAAEADQDPAA